MAMKDEWKETGKGLGHAFAGLGKNILRSAKDGVDVVTGDEQPTEVDENGRPINSFNDGSWRRTGKELGNSLLGLGKSIVHSAQVGLDNLDNLTSDGQGEAQKDAASSEESE